MVTRHGQPIVRLLQARFRRDSAEAMKRAMRGDGGRYVRRRRMNEDSECVA
jgi:hypothetical protein